MLAADNAYLDPITWINFGALGLVLLGLIAGWLWTKPSVDRLIEEKDRAVREREKADAQRDAMAQVLQDKLLPLVGDFVTTTQALLPVLQELVRQQGESRDRPPLLRSTQGQGQGRRAKPDRPRD